MEISNLQPEIEINEYSSSKKLLAHFLTHIGSFTGVLAGGGNWRGRGSPPKNSLSEKIFLVGFS